MAELRFTKSVRIGNIIGAIVVTFLAIGLLFWLGSRTINSLSNPSPVSSSTVPEEPPKIEESEKQVVIFENPLINEPGLAVKELTDKKDEYKGKAVEVKGAVGSRDGDWGFWLNETNGDRKQVFILTHPSLASQTASQFSLIGQKYVRVRGVLKDVVWTRESTVEEATLGAQAAFSPPQRLSIIADEIIPIED